MRTRAKGRCCESDAGSCSIQNDTTATIAQHHQFVVAGDSAASRSPRFPDNRNHESTGRNEGFVVDSPSATTLESPTSAQSLYKGQIMRNEDDDDSNGYEQEETATTTAIVAASPAAISHGNNNNNNDPNDDSILQYSPGAIRRSLFPASGFRHQRRRFVHPHRGGLRPDVALSFKQKRNVRSRRIPLIPAEHPLKVAWDFLTVLLSFLNAYATHTSIRDRQFADNTFLRFCEIWFAVDLLLNFCSEYKTGDGLHLKDVSAVWARYLTTWFAVDLISLFPGEVLYLQPIIERQNRRSFFQKSFFRTKAVLRVTRFLRGHHFKYFGQVAKQTKRAANVGSPRLLRLIIKYVPKYWLFLRNMKGVVAIRLLRQIHWFRKVYLNGWGRSNSSGSSSTAAAGMMTIMIKPSDSHHVDDEDEATYSMTDEDYYDLDSYYDDNDDGGDDDDDGGYFCISSSADDGRDLLFDDSFFDDDDDDDHNNRRVLDDTSTWNDDDEYGPY